VNRKLVASACGSSEPDARARFDDDFSGNYDVRIAFVVPSLSGPIGYRVIDAWSIAYDDRRDPFAAGRHRDAGDGVEREEVVDRHGSLGASGLRKHGSRREQQSERTDVPSTHSDLRYLG
jgi:hypothetical protein